MQRNAKMKKRIAILIGCLSLTVACGLGRLFYLKTRPVTVPIDKYVENLDKARKEADNARKEWMNHKEERQKAEIARLKKLNIPDLSKKAVRVLVRHEEPEYIVNKAIARTRSEMGVWIITPPWGNGTDPKYKKFWSMIYRGTKDKDHDWWIEQNKMWGQYRLVGSPNQSIYFSIHDESKLQTVLAYIVIFGNTKPFYQVVANSTDTPKEGCEVLSLDEAGKLFPETMNLVEGVYAKHPYNPYVLFPLLDFHANCAMNKYMECIVLLGKMGAKSVHVSRLDGEKSGGGGGIGASFKGINAAINSALASGMKSKMDLKVVFEGQSHVDISPKLLENSIWHKSDAQLNGILAAILSGNKPKDLSVTEEEESDYNFDFKAAAGVLGIAEAELKARVEKNRQTQRVFHVVF